MEICEENHKEIVHNEKYCPLCHALDELGEARNQIEELGEKQ